MAYQSRLGHSRVILSHLTFWILFWGLLGYCQFSSAQSLPRQIREWLRIEQTINNRDAGDGFTPLDFSQFPPEYDPQNQPVWPIGYLEIPLDQLQVLKSELSASAKEILLIPAQNGNPEKIRFFIHPHMENQYAREISKFGFHKGEYLATPTSSPRSLIIWKKSNPNLFTAQKVSLDIEVGGVSRINGTSKLLRAFAVSQAAHEISPQMKQKYGFDVMLEPMVARTKDKAYGNITRDLPTDLHLIPGFALASTGPGQATPPLIEMINRSSLSTEEFLEAKILRPLLKAYAYLTFSEGLIGEPHQQNVLFQLNSQGELTGKVIFRDLDAYKADLWLRELQGHSNQAFADSIFTAKDLNVDLAHEAYGRSYVTYIRSEWEYLFRTLLLNHLKDFKNPNEAKDILRSQWLSKTIDRIFFEEVREHLGPNSMPLWANGKDEKQINKIVQNYKSRRLNDFLALAREKDFKNQKQIEKSYAREYALGRTTSKEPVNAYTYYSEVQGAPLAIDLMTRTVSFGLSRWPFCRAVYQSAH